METEINQAPIHIVSFSRAAGRLATTPPTVKNYAKRGLLEVVRLPGRKRASGVTGASLEKLIRSNIVRLKVGQEEEQ